MGGESMVCIVPAAGTGSRLGGAERKAFVPLAGVGLALRTCRALKRHPQVTEIVLAVHPEDLERVEGELWDEFSAAGVGMVVAGGECRAQSVWSALEVVPASATLVAVHDAARPFVTVNLLDLLAKTARARGAAIPILPLADTPKRIEADHILDTPSRDGWVRAQTPQVFQVDLLIEAYEFAIRTGGLTAALTDDSLLVERFGQPVAAVYGEEFNFKITTPADLRLAETLLAAGLVE